MLTDHEFAVHRFATYAREVIQPAIYGATTPLQAAAFQCSDPIPLNEATGASYEPVQIGWRWGPAWTTAWFRVTGAVPASMAGRCVALRFSSGTEALLWDNGAPRQGFDANRDTLVLFDSARGGEPVEFLIEAACNHPFGITAFAWDPPETQKRWNSPKPGELQCCELAVYDDGVRRLWRAYEFAQLLMAELPADSSRTQALSNALRRATQCIDDADVPRTADAAIEILTEALRGDGVGAATECFAVGHAHIDTAWLWPLRETRRKCQRTLANVLGLMERFPDFPFLCSQAQQYAWIEQDAPELFARIADRVREGRWEAAGAMWVEPDCYVPSGESLVRQIIHGTRYWREKFGDAAPQRFVYLPDTFGFPAALPQIMAQAGIDTFITNKLAWNQVNDWPHVTFRWRGIDDTEILAHCTPGHDYNAQNTPAELRRGETNAAQKDKGRTGAWLQPFGFGDGGGGPTAAMIERALLAEQCEGLPRVTLSRAGALCDILHQRRSTLLARGEDLPVWDGELYLELHRGTCTTQSWLKKANRCAEESLRKLEWLAFGGPSSDERAGDEFFIDELDATWKLLLLNQFHDILPGTSITMVYNDAKRDHERIAAFCERSIDRATDAWAQQADTTGLTRPMMVLNATSHSCHGVVECEEALHYIAEAPALGAAMVDRDRQPSIEPVHVDGQTLSNGVIAATIDEAGPITSLRRLDSDRDACRDEPLNQLKLYEDRPQSWEAWDIDAHYPEKPIAIDGPVESWRIVEEHPLRCAIEVDRPVGASSRITQRFILEAGSPRLDIRTRVIWHESRRLLRTQFPVDVRARNATYDIQFGCLERPTHRNTSWEQAMFEVCAHRWMDLSEPGFGVALLNDGKYGHSCEGNVMGLTLLRSSKHPDPEADMGEHEFTYSLMPHHGDWRAAGVDREAHALNAPLTATPLPVGQEGSIQGSYCPVEIAADGAASVFISALKRAEDDDRLILRLVETHGGRGRATISWNLPVNTVEPVDLLERPTSIDSFSHDASTNTSTVALRPFRIITLAARLT